MENNCKVHPNAVFGIAMKMRIKKELLEKFEPYDEAYMKAVLTIQRDVIDEILYEIEKEKK